MPTLLNSVILFLLAWLADNLIKKYWGSKGLRSSWLILAGYSLLMGIRHRDILDLGFGVLALWMARPGQGKTRSADGLAQSEEDKHLAERQ